MRLRLATVGSALVLTAAAGGPVAAAPEPARIAVVPVDIGTSEHLLNVTFPDPRLGFAVGENGAILATTDGGVTWSRQRSGLEISAEEVASRTAGTRAARQPVHLFGVSFTSARQGWAVGGGAILTTTDGGATWTSVRPPELASIPGEGPGRLGQPQRAVEWQFRGVRFLDDKRGVVVGGGGTVLVTDDGGRTWTWRGDRRFGNLDDISFADGSHGQAVGETGGGVGQLSVSIATADGGSSWELREATGVGHEVATAQFFAVATPSVDRAYVAGEAGRIFVTVDGGHRWAVQRRDTTERFQAMAFATPNRGVVVGHTDFSGTSRASLVVTDDGGETWVSRLLAGESLSGVAFATPETAYAVGCAERLAEEKAVPVVQADGEVSDLRPCQRSMLLRISFAPGSGAGGGGGGFPFLPVAGLAAALLALAVVVGRGRRRR